MKTTRLIPAVLLAATSLFSSAQAQEFREIPVQPDPQPQEELTKEKLYELAQGRMIEEVERASQGDLEAVQRLFQERARQEMLLDGPHQRDAGERAPWMIGLSVTPIEPILREHLQIDEDTGARVSFVAEDKPAAKAGIEENDILISADGQKIANLEQLRGAVARCGKEGRPLRMEIIHHGKRRPVVLQVEGPKPEEAREHAERTGEPRDPDLRLPRLIQRIERQEQQIRELQKEVRQLRQQMKKEAREENEEDQE